MKNRVFQNPRINDKVTVLVSPEETNGAFIIVEVELKPGGGVALHYHTSFDEEFTAVDGIVGIELGKQTLLLQPGQKAIARKNQLHRFYNPGPINIRFHVKITPGIERFVQSLCIGYGLATDGLTNNKGIPKKFDHLAVLIEMSDTRFPGFLSLIEKLLLRRAKRARRRGVDKMLIEKYCV